MSASPPVDQPPPLLHEISDVRRHLGNASRSYVYELFARGEFESVKLGRRRLVPHDKLVEFVERHAARTAGGDRLAS